MEQKPEPDARQRTLFDLKKVVRLESSAVCFSSEEVAELKKTLLDPCSPKWLLLQTLRKLDCFRFEFNDLVKTEVGSAAATLTAHPKLEVAKLAHNVMNKWRALIEAELFKALPYDAELAATIPEDPPVPPPPTAEEVAADRAAAQELRRQRELDFLTTDSEDELMGESESDGSSSGDDWRPGKSRRSVGKRKQTHGRQTRQRKQQQEKQQQRLEEGQ